MFQDEKTTELELNASSQQPTGSIAHSRWTEQKAQSLPFRQASAATLSHKPGTLEPHHIPWLIKLAAAVSILILSLWLF